MHLTFTWLPDEPIMQRRRSTVVMEKPIILEVEPEKPKPWLLIGLAVGVPLTLVC